MTLTGDMIIGASTVRGTAGTLHAINPTTGEVLEPTFHGGDESSVNQACELAEAAFDIYRNTEPDVRARFLETIADEIDAIGEPLLERAHAETALPMVRLRGERGRTTGQLRLFAQVLRSGRWQSATFDTRMTDRTPPRPDLRMQHIAVGPVAVFGASNFPLAFSVAGGDTASALAAGCPVVVKAHPAHPGTSEYVARAIQKAVAKLGLPEGTFSMVTGGGNALGGALVKHPNIQAVGFTGSRAGGLALVALASARHEPIPVYAEMSSVNPMFLMPSALNARGETIGRQFVESLVMGAGQFCTNPGLVIAVRSPALDRFRQSVLEAIAEKAAVPMLTPGIHQAYEKGLTSLSGDAKVEQLAQGLASSGPNQAQAAFLETTATAFLADPALQAEVFGPASLLVVCDDAAQVRAVARKLEGQLTATVHADDDDADEAGQLLPVLERKAGRVLFNSYPTGVEVSYAMVHGGPFPATSDGRSTSVGATSIHRFLRPVCYQDVPAKLLPAALRDDNPLKVWRLVDGELLMP